MSPRILIVRSDGGSRGNPGPAGYGAVVEDADSGRILVERAAYIGEVSNNVAEYHGMIAGITAALELDPQATLDIRMDSKLVVQQMNGVWKIKHPDMKKLAVQARQLLSGRKATFSWVPRAENAAADKLANEAMDTRASVKRGGGSVQSGPAVSVGLDDTTPSAAILTDTDNSSASARIAAHGQSFVSGRAPLISNGPATTILLVRHGVTDQTKVDTYAGSTTVGPGLAPEGKAQAEEAAELVSLIADGLWPDVSAPTAVLSSPMTRARETAEQISDRLGLEVTTMPGFAEMNFGEWDGKLLSEVEDQWPGGPESLAQDPEFSPPGGESRTQVTERVRACLSQLLAQYPGQTVVVVSHVVAIRAALGVVLGAPASISTRFRIMPASLTGVRLWSDRTMEILGTNWSLLGSG